MIVDRGAFLYILVFFVVLQMWNLIATEVLSWFTGVIISLSIFFFVRNDEIDTTDCLNKINKSNFVM